MRGSPRWLAKTYASPRGPRIARLMAREPSCQRVCANNFAFSTPSVQRIEHAPSRTHDETARTERPRKQRLEQVLPVLPCIYER